MEATEGLGFPKMTGTQSNDYSMCFFFKVGAHPFREATL